MSGRGSMTERRLHVWRLVASGGFDPVSGKRVQHIRTVQGGKREAQKALTALLRDVDQGLVADAGALTVAEFLEAYLVRAVARIRGTTHARYSSLIRRQVVPRIGRVKMRDLKPVHLQRVLDQAGASGLSARTVVQIHRVLHAALEEAVGLQMLPRNPSDAVRPPRPDRPDLEVADAAVITRVLEEAQGSRYYPALVLAAHTGMRRGEVLGLHWREVDLDGGRLEVMATLQRVGTELIFADPKTDRSRRSIRLTRGAVEALRAQRRDQASRRLAAGAAWRDTGLVFDRGDGGPVEPSKLSGALKVAAAKAGVPRLRLHDLRHAVATSLLRENVNPRLVADLLGHSSVVITLDTYSHVLPSMGEVAAEALQRAFDARRADAEGGGA